MTTTDSEQPYDVLIIGGGLAGLSAAHHAASRGLSVASIDDGGHMGGLVINVNQVDGFPDMDPVSGVELAAAKLAAILELGVEIIPERVSRLTIEGDVKAVTTDGGVYRAQTIVLASGARLKSLGVPGEKTLFGYGVSQCAGCDAGFFMDQHVVVVGGGDSALQEALHISDYASAITLVTRGDALRAKSSFFARVLDNPKIAVRLSSRVSEILGSDRVEGVRLTSVDDADGEDIACSGVFVFVGLKPNVDYLPNIFEQDADGLIVSGPNYESNVPGVYAIGAVRSGYSGQLVDAVSEAEAVIQSLRPS